MKDEISGLGTHKPMAATLEPGSVLDSVGLAACPDCGAILWRSHFPGDVREFEHWVDRCLCCGYGREYKDKDGKVEEWFQHPNNQPSASAPETRPCPICGKRMIKWSTGEVLLSYPAQYPWRWRCACGHQEPGGIEHGKADRDLFQAEWEAANASR